MKKAHLRRCPHPSSLRRTSRYASLLRISGALHLCIFDQPEIDFCQKMSEVDHSNTKTYLALRSLGFVGKVLYGVKNVHQVGTDRPEAVGEDENADGNQEEATHKNDYLHVSFYPVKGR